MGTKTGVMHKMKLSLKQTHKKKSRNLDFTRKRRKDNTSYYKLTHEYSKTYVGNVVECGTEVNRGLLYIEKKVRKWNRIGCGPT